MNNFSFNEYQQSTMDFYHRVADALESPEDLAYAERLTAATLGVLRELITTEQSLHLISNLPMMIKGVYVNGWKLRSERVRVKTREEFFALLREKYPRTTGRTLGDYQSVRKDVKAVLSVLKTYISEGGLEHIQSQLPQPIADLWEREAFEDRMSVG